ncbi:hypothetical protein ACFL5O_00750 [Myxococcota bacterium]
MTPTPRSTLLLLSVLLTGGCKDPSSANTDQPSTPGAASALSDEELEKADIPVKEDFEAQAQVAITADNLDDQVKNLEQEITADN